MKLVDFHIGDPFWTESGAWRCTDVGTRTVVAIKLGDHRVVEMRRVGQRDVLTESITADPSRLVGPPYAVREEVFDEDDIQACYPSPEAMRGES